MHVVQGLYHLDRKPFSQSHREALEVVVLDKLVQVDAQHLKADKNMTSESK